MRARLIFALVLLAGIFFGGYWFWKGGSGDAAPEGPFSLVEAADRELDGSPALALTFSEPLDGRVGYDRFVQVFEMPPRDGEAPPPAPDADESDYWGDEPPGPGEQVSTTPQDTDTEGGKPVAGAWVVGENPRLLFFPHIKPQTRYIVRIAVGLPSRGGQKLGTESRYSIRTAAVSPAYYFASRGMVLPARQNGGLPVVTVNVPEVDIQFLKVKSDQLPRFLDKVTSGKKDAEEEGEEDDNYGYDRTAVLRGAVGNWDLDRIHKLTESVYSGRFVTERKADRRGVTFIPVEDIKELKEPGVYIAVMSQPNRFRYDYQVTYFYVSDLGLHARLFKDRADAWVSSLVDGKAVSGVEVSWLDGQGKILAQAETDNLGRAAFAERPGSAKVLLAKKDRQVSLIALKEPALDLSEFDTVGLPSTPVRLFAWSGRDLYRPGEGFDLSVLARDADGNPVPSQQIQATLRRPDGKTQFTSFWQPEKAFGGYYRHRLEIPADAPTGSWTLELRADPADKVAATSYRFGVEEFLPERMKLDLAAKVAELDGSQPMDVEVHGSYLYGAPAAGNRLLGVVQYEPSANPLAKELPGFQFGDAGEDSVRERVELEETELDDKGGADVHVDLAPVADRHSPFRVRATLSLLESGGRPVVRSIERIWWPAPVLVGVRPLFEGDYAREDSPVQFEVVRANTKGHLKAGSAMPVRLFRENRNYYWRFDDQRGWHSGFTDSDELVESLRVDVPAGGRGKLTMPVKYGRYRLEILDPETGQTLKYRFYAGWNAKSDETQGVRPDRVGLKLDKVAYREGEDTVHLTISPPHAGEALVTVEGDETLWAKRISVPAGGATLSIPVDKAWKRHDLYVTALVLRPGGEGDKVTPARALGMAYLPLERGERKLSVQVSAPVKMRPEQPMTVKVKVPEAKGESALVTLSAVDVGILNITRYATPDPFGFFFGKLRYGADQYDVYGRLIEKMAGQKGKLKYGGDSAPKPTRSLPKKVKLVDLFSGPVALDEKGEAEITLPVPDFNGSLRLMAVAASPSRFGSAESEVTVAAPLVAELATPRFLTVGDSAVVALDLHNLSGGEQKLKVNLVNADGLKIGDAERSLSLANQKKVTLRFPLEAGSAIGLADVRVRVEGSGPTGPIHLDRSFGLQVQAPTPSQQVVRRYVVEPGQSLDVRDAELAGFLKPTVAANLALSNRPPIDVRAAVHGLLTYPWGCAEQTTSTAYPHVFIDEEAARRFGLKPFSRERRAEMLEKAMGRLSAMQAPVGGFSLWGNASEYEYWLSAYVANFLLDAREQGFAVPAAMQRKAMDFLLKGLQEGVGGLPSGKAVVSYNANSVWRDYRYAGSGRFGVLAYGSYVLAREAKAPLSTLRQLYESRGLAHSGLSLVQLGLALKLMGDEARGNTAIAEGVKKPRLDNYWWGDYGSVLRDAALSYALLNRHKVQVDGKENLLAQVADEMTRNRYYSTQEKLALFLAGSDLAGGDSGPWSAEFAVGGKETELKAEGSHYQALAAADVAKGVSLRNTGKGKLFVELSLSGNPAKALAPRSEDIALTREFYDAGGEPIGDRSLRVGESVLVRLKAKSKYRIANGLVVDHIPAGLEIENLNLVQGESTGSVTVAGVDPAEAMADRRIKHVEFRDDRFAAAVRLDGGEINLFYRARVVTPGRFVVPPLYAEDMYRPAVYGLAGGEGSLTVKDARTGGD